LHHYVKADRQALDVPPLLATHSSGFTQQMLVDRGTGSVHMGFAYNELSPGGAIDAHVHSREESFYLVDGHPHLTMLGQTFELGPDHCGLIPVGVPHAWTNPAGTVARWGEMMAPVPRLDNRPPDTFFVEPLRAGEPAPIDLRDPRTRHLFRLDPGQMDTQALGRGARVDAPTVSSSMATALLAYSGIAVKMLVDQRLDCQLSTMFMVEYQPGGVAHPHDHPFEELYWILEGEVELIADDVTHNLTPGDVLWTGAGCIHAAYNRTDTTVRWLETQAPVPPPQYSYRFDRDWDYLAGAAGDTASGAALPGERR
jgi:quercetin dioxygenase-like cupin family protein